MNFILSCESTIDIPFAYTVKREIPVMFYSYQIDGAEYEDDMMRSENGIVEFYNKLSSGKLASTSQINEYRYYVFFKSLIIKGDILHIALGSGMTPSVKNAVSAANKIKEEFPERKIIVIDSLASCAGYGLLVDSAADLRDEGKSIEEVEKWVLDNRKKVHHQFFSTDMKFFKRSGRVNGAAAVMASVLNICPIMHLDENGKIVAYSKVRGKKNAIETTAREMLANCENGKEYDKKCIICHSNCLDMALETKDRIEELIPTLKGKTEIYSIGTIIGAHSGPGTVAVFFYGKERK